MKSSKYHITCKFHIQWTRICVYCVLGNVLSVQKKTVFWVEIHNEIIQILGL